MRFFRRKKVKLSLIDDYAKILIVENLYKNSSFELLKNEQTKSLFNEVKLLNVRLKTEYETLFNKLKLNDLSLLILKKEFESNNFINSKNFLIFQSKILEIKGILTSISINLPQKLNFLKIKI